MKTQKNNTIDMQTESLEEATKRYPDTSTAGYNDHWNRTKQTAFIQGANWQKEKDIGEQEIFKLKANQDKLIEALKRAKTKLYMMLVSLKEKGVSEDDAISFAKWQIEEFDNLIQSIEKETL